VGRRDRPVAGLLGVLADARRPVHGALVAQSLEEIVRRSVEPQLALADEHVVKIAADRRHRDLLIVCVWPARSYWLAGQTCEGSARAPHHPRVAEAQRPLGRLGEVELASGDEGTAVDDGYADGASVVAKRDDHAAGKRAVGDAERRALKGAAAGEPSTAPVPGHLHAVVDVQAPQPPARGLG